MTSHRAGPVRSVQVTADRDVSVSPPRSIAGPGFDVTLTGTSRGVTGEVDGSPEPEQVLRLLGRRGVLGEIGAAADEAVRVRAETPGGGDETAVYSGDDRLSRRFALRRTWDPDGPVALWFGFNPILADLRGSPARVPPRPSLRNVTTIADRVLGGLGALTVLNLFRRRSGAAGDIPASASPPEIERELVRRHLGEADLVLAAWGARARERHLPRIRRLWRTVGESGRRLHAPAVDGRVRLTRRWPRQPCHPARTAAHGVGLVPLPREWLEGFDPAGVVGCHP